MFYIWFFGLITHKESRFMLPVWPFILLMTGQFFAETMKSNRNIGLLKWVVKLYIIVELLTLYVLEFKLRG